MTVNSKKLKRLKQLSEADQPLKVFDRLNDLEDTDDKLAQKDTELEQKLDSELTAVVTGLKALDDKKADKQELERLDEQKLSRGQLEAIKGELAGKDGKDYVLTDFDRQEIASRIKVPIVEKTEIRTEVIKEQPIITNEIKEVAIVETPEVIAEKLNTLEKVIEKNVIIGLEEEIKKLRAEIQSSKPIMGMRKIPIVRAIDLTSQVDGIVTTYTLPMDTVKILAVFSTQFPVIFAGSTDFSFSGRTLTLNTGVVQSGQTLNCLTEALFYSK